ncbi:MAG: nucleotidyltransferase family protein [Bacteroidota bacterium]
MNTSKNIELQVPPLGGGGGVAIILAGGLGTRLRSVVSQLPKCMAPVAGKPFLHYVICYLQKQGVENFIFSIGYLSEAIENFLAENYPLLNYQLSVEEEPLGTGGAIYLACKKANAKNVLALNGDTLFAADINALLNFHVGKKSECSLALKPMQQFERYGVVKLDSNNCIKSFQEKKYYDEGLINGGVYVINKEMFLSRSFPEKFSFEKDYLEAMVKENKFYGLEQDEYFIDIGIPEDFERAQKEFAELKM